MRYLLNEGAIDILKAARPVAFRPEIIAIKSSTKFDRPRHCHARFQHRLAERGPRMTGAAGVRANPD